MILALEQEHSDDRIIPTILDCLNVVFSFDTLPVSLYKFDIMVRWSLKVFAPYVSYALYWIHSACANNYCFCLVISISCYNESL